MWTQAEIDKLLYVDIPILTAFLGAIIISLIILIIVTSTKN